MFEFRSIYPIGIDIGEHGIYVAQFRQNGKSPVVRALYHKEISVDETEGDDRAEILALLLKRISRNRKFSGKRLAMHLPPQSISSFPIRFQVGKAEDMEEAIVSKSREYLSYDLDKAVIDYPSLIPGPSTEDGDHQAIVTVVKREIVEHYALIARQAGLVLDVVDFPVSSLIRLHHFLHGPIDNPILLVHLGLAESFFAVLTRDALLAERTVSWGIRFLLKKISNNLGLSQETQKARLLLEKYGLRYEELKGRKNDVTPVDHDLDEELCRVIYQIVTPYVEELVDEIHKTLSYIRAEEQNAYFERIYLYGHGPLIFHLDGYIEGRLNIPTSAVNPMSRLRYREADPYIGASDASLFSLALGLAMRKVPWL